MLGLHITDECLEQFFVFLPFLECWSNSGGGVLYQFDRNNLSVVLTHRHIGSVTICKTVYYCRSLPPYSGQCCWHLEGAHFVAYTIVEQNTQRMFVRLYRLLLIHCIYVSVTKPAWPAFGAWLNTGAIRSMKVTGKATMLCSYGININVMCSTTWPN